jgi:ribosomal protein S18 acetylase RimI-like enzyme
MWDAFVGAKPSEPGNRDMASVNWSRVMDADHPLQCIVAVNGSDRPQGFTLYLALPFTWSVGDVCYLQDIFVRPEARGAGHARAMIEHLKGLGRQNGWYKIFWMTEADNERAKRLYEKVARRMDYLRYDIVITAP